MSISTHFPVSWQGHTFVFSKYLGCLLRYGRRVRRKPFVAKSEKERRLLEAVDNPYLLDSPQWPGGKPPMPRGMVRAYAKTLTWLCRRSFLLAYWFSKMGRPCYADAREAVMAYRAIFPGKRQRKLCLARALFAAALSRRFKTCGVAFVGVFMPSVQMHAWVLEDNRVADPYDNQWTCYRPVAIIS